MAVYVPLPRSISALPEKPSQGSSSRLPCDPPSNPFCGGGRPFAHSRNIAKESGQSVKDAPGLSDLASFTRHRIVPSPSSREFVNVLTSFYHGSGLYMVAAVGGGNAAPSGAFFLPPHPVAGP